MKQIQTMQKTKVLRRCSTCENEKDTSEFGSDRSREDGLAHRCRECERARNLARGTWRLWREAHPEKARSAQRTWDRTPRVTTGEQAS